MGTNGPAQVPVVPAATTTTTTGIRRQPAATPRVDIADPWCDDGSLSRAEPPWLRDKRMKQQRDRLQQQKERLTQRVAAAATGSSSSGKSPTNPFEDDSAAPVPAAASTINPFDTSSVNYSYSDSSQNSSSHHHYQNHQYHQYRPGGGQQPGTTTTTTSRAPPTSNTARTGTSPIEEKKEGDAASMRRQPPPQPPHHHPPHWQQHPVPPYQPRPRSTTTTRTKGKQQQRTNPFDSDSSTNPSSSSQVLGGGGGVNPFDTSGESSEPPVPPDVPVPVPVSPDVPAVQQPVPAVRNHHRPRIIRPTATRPSLQKNPQKQLQMAYTDESVQDSLDQFLDTTEDETADASTSKDESVGKDPANDNDNDEDDERLYRQMQQQMLGPYYVSGTTSSEATEDFDDASSGISSMTPSERALKAAQSLKESFGRSNNNKHQHQQEQQQRRQTSSSSSSPVTPNSNSNTTQPRNANIVTPTSQRDGALSPPETPKSPAANIPGASVRPPSTKRVVTPTPTGAGAGRTTTPRSPQDFPSLLQSTKLQQQQQYDEQQQELIPQEEEQQQQGNKNTDAGEEQLNLTLHDLCDEARTTDDVAWRNALYLLSVQPELASHQEPECQLTVLHVCCMALHFQQPPPVWMVRALLYTNPQQCQQEDSGGRLPLHLLAATSANVELMQLLVDEYPGSVSHADRRGFTPLHLLLKNDQIPMTLEHLRILLGQTTTNDMSSSNNSNKKKGGRHISFRKREHLKQSFQDLQDLQIKQQEKHEQVFEEEYPEDVQQCIRKISQWKRRQVNRGLYSFPQNSNQMANVYRNPASIPTPSTRQWPLHLLVRRKLSSKYKHDGDDNDNDNDMIGSIKLANAETLIRVMIAAYPEALLETDIHGRTPLLTSLLQSDSLPDVETVELLLGKYTPGICSDPTQTPARLASTDTLQLPLHVAAEELANNFELLSTIAEAYPHAVQVQDIRGRTPLHCALLNFRSVSVDEATFSLLLMSRNHNYEQVAKTSDADGKRPLDLIIERPRALKQWSTEEVNGDDDDNGDSYLLLSAFLNASIDMPRSDRQARDLLERIRTLPPWLRRSACASSHVQRVLLEELASPSNTALVLLQGGTLISLLIVLRIALESTGIDFDSWVLVNYFCAYHLATQLLYWGTACYLGEFYRMVLANGWRWIDLMAICCSIGTATVVQTDITSLRESNVADFMKNFVPADDDTLIATLGAWATGLLWLSLVGYLVQWWCAMAVFVGSAIQVVRTLFWPIALAAMGIVAMSQILNTLENCVEGNICGIEDAYTTVYWMILGEPILGLGELSVFENETTTSMMVLIIFFTLLWLLWLVSVLAMTVSEAYRLDRHQIALRWFWEPKVALTVTARPTPKETLFETPSCTKRYCDSMERLWHVLSSSIRGGHRKHEVNWYAWCFRPGVIFLTRLLACIILPIWFWLGVATLGLLWPPQLRRWLFSTKIMVDQHGKKPKGPTEERLTAAKLSHLKGEMEEYQSKSMDQNYVIQQDLAQIKELLFRAMETEDSPAMSGSW